MKILIVGPSWVGDSGISQSLFKIIQSRSQYIEIDVLSPEWTINIYERMDEISETILLPFDHGELRFKERVEFGKSLGVKNYDQAIVLPNSFTSITTKLFIEPPMISRSLSPSISAIIGGPVKGSSI